ncbi:MAG: hypothetical protein QW429_01965 [Thermoprotei archaeon]
MGYTYQKSTSGSGRHVRGGSISASERKIAGHLQQLFKQLGGKPRKAHLTLAYIGLTALFLALLALGYSHRIPFKDPESVVLAVGAGLIVFEARREAYRERTDKRLSASLAFLDLVAYYAIIVILVWGFIYPLIRQVPPDYQLYILYTSKLSMSLYAGLLVAGLIIAFRVALQPIILTRAATDEARINLLIQTLNTLLERLDKAAYTQTDEKITQTLKNMEEQVAKIRTELSHVATPQPPPLGWTRQAPPPSAATPPTTRTVEATPSNAKAHTQPPNPQPNPQARQAEALPDAAVDNPWAAVLSKRSRKKGEASSDTNA